MSNVLVVEAIVEFGGGIVDAALVLVHLRHGNVDDGLAGGGAAHGALPEHVDVEVGGGLLHGSSHHVALVVVGHLSCFFLG